MGRPLSGMERGLWKTDLAAPLNFTTVARVSGPLSDDALRAALPALRARHPHLRERIEAGEFVDDGVPPLSLRVSSRGWLEELEDELNGRIELPLARFVRAGDRLLITLHHAIGDGMSGVYLMRDWLQAATGARLEPLTDPGGVDACVHGAPGLPNHLRFILREAWLTARDGLPLKLRREQQRFCYQRRTRVRHVVLEAAQVEALAARARREKTTVHGALSAAMLLGLLHDTGKAKAGVMFGSPVNVRASLGVGEQVGFFVSMLGFRDAVRADMPLWELARTVRRSLEADLATKLELSLINLMPTLWNVLGADDLEPRTLGELWERFIPTTSGLTNLGRLNVQTQFGALKLEECHFAASPSALGDFLATATSLHGKLFWNFLWPEPVISDAHAEALVADIVERVRSSVA